MPSTKSGGARQTERKRRSQAAKRPRGYDGRCIRQLAAIQRAAIDDPTGLLLEAQANLALHMRHAGTDPGMPAEYRREQGGRLAAALVKSLDQAAELAELKAEYTELQEAFEKLRARDAAQELPRDQEGPPPATSLS